MRALIHVNHMLGTGHAFRACRLGKALARSGVSVTVATGNTLPDTIDTSDLDICHLPLARSMDTSFSQLVDDAGTPIDKRWQEQRQKALWDIWEQTNPDIFVTEHFPFGRRKLEFELVPILEEIRKTSPGTLVVSSVRDILVAKRDSAKELRMANIAEDYYDLILVHSDERVIPLEESFPFVKNIQHLIQYSGFLHSSHMEVQRHSPRRNEIVVSAGGGAFGAKLIKTAIQTGAAFSNNSDYSWRILCGPNICRTELDSMGTDLPSNITMESNRPDFQELLSESCCSISQAGYNTVLDIVCAKVPAILIPSPVNENEQVKRARILADHGCARIVEESALTANTLAIAIKDALSMKFKPMDIKMDDGSECSKTILNSLKQKRQTLQKS